MVLPNVRKGNTIQVNLPIFSFFLWNFFLSLSFLIGNLVRKMNSNRFISRLVDQNPVSGVLLKSAHLTFMPSTETFDLIFHNYTLFLGILNCVVVWPEICIDMEVFFL